MPIQTPICDFGQKAHDFKLKSTEGKILSLADVTGEKGTLIMFICNHCPYVKAVTKDIFEDCKKLIPIRDGDSDLLKAMTQIAKTNKGPEKQIPSAGCGIKWKTN